MQLTTQETTLVVIAVIVGLCYLVRCIRIKKIFVEKSNRKVVILEPTVEAKSIEITVRLYNILKGSRLHKVGLRNGRYAKIRSVEDNVVVKTSKTRFNQLPSTRCPITKDIFHEGFIWAYISPKQYKVTNA